MNSAIHLEQREVSQMSKIGHSRILKFLIRDLAIEVLADGEIVGPQTPGPSASIC